MGDGSNERSTSAFGGGIVLGNRDDPVRQKLKDSPMSVHSRQSKTRSDEAHNDQTSKAKDRQGTTYGRWQIHETGEIRLLLTVRHGEPVIDFRYGEYGVGGAWTPSARGVFLKLHELPGLWNAVGEALKDIRRLRLVNGQGRHDR
jgi:hypothetical protein